MRVAPFLKVYLIHCKLIWKFKKMIWDFVTDFLTGEQREESQKIKEIKKETV